ncbi:hypothetical protein CQW23_24358 [Capsicum baccatum]|uniref:Uncharacterized protein n=1 Tax=Capsicum baccatum TaxID=33114 RepID=A0A2G2VUJ6_CAPBA|nr:hypothetical protein CQW23_24358 [Capsicum baccatum]
MVDHQLCDGPPTQPSARDHNITTLVPSILANSNFSLVIPGDGNKLSLQSEAAIVASGDVLGDSKIAASILRRELEFSSTLDTRPRNQSIWRRPSDRFPRIISSPTVEKRADLLELEEQVKKLVEDLKSTFIDMQRTVTAEFWLLAKHNMDKHMVIVNCGAISLFVNLLHSEDMKVQEDILTTLLNLSINDNNKCTIANADAIEPLIHEKELRRLITQLRHLRRDLPLSQEQNKRIWLDAVGGPSRYGYAYGLPQRTFREFYSELEGLGSFQDNESRETILALKQQIAELSSEAKASQARKRKRVHPPRPTQSLPISHGVYGQYRDVTEEPSSDEDDEDYYVDNTLPYC